MNEVWDEEMFNKFLRNSQNLIQENNVSDVNHFNQGFNLIVEKINEQLKYFGFEIKKEFKEKLFNNLFQIYFNKKTLRNEESIQNQIQ